MAKVLAGQALAGSGQIAGQAGSGQIAGQAGSGQIAPDRTQAEASEAGLPDASAQETGLAGTGLAGTGLAGTGLTGTGLNGSLHTIDLTTHERWVRGRVTGTGGDPLPGATITLVGSDGNEVGHGVAGHDGEFHIPCDRQGTFTMVAAAPHYRATASVVVVSAGVASANVQLLGVGLLTGRVSRESDRAPLRAEIELVSAAGTVAMACQTDDEGTFTLPDVLEGTYEVVAWRQGYEPQRAGVSLVAGDSRRVELRLTGVGHVYGSVSSQRGAWLPDIPVLLADQGGRQLASATTDGAGSFHLPPVQEGIYVVGVAGAPKSAVTIELRPGAALNVDLTVAR